LKNPIKKADIIVSLGGDNGDRIKKTLELYKKNYSKSKKIILTGVDNFDSDMKIYELSWRAYYLTKKGINKSNIIINTTARNTMEEIKFIKNYLIKNHLHSVIFVSAPPHSRRLHFFIERVFKYKDFNISYQIISSEPKWWNKNKYYTNPDAIIFAINEIIKLSYYYLKYESGNYNEK